MKSRMLIPLIILNCNLGRTISPAVLIFRGGEGDTKTLIYDLSVAIIKRLIFLMFSQMLKIKLTRLNEAKRAFVKIFFSILAFYDWEILPPLP